MLPDTEIATREVALPEPVARRGITEAQWRTLANNLYPGAASASVLMVWDYCAARGLDPLKKPCHIVPIRVKDAKTGEWGWRDVVMPGIYEYRTTAHRTGQYLGHSAPEYGPTIEHGGVRAPAWCAMTMYRASSFGDGGRIEFPVRRYFVEVVGLTKEGKANDRWSRAPIQMLEKCTEAAGLREAFPDEFGGETTADERHDGGEPRSITVPTVRRLSSVAPAPVPERRDTTIGPTTIENITSEPAGYCLTTGTRDRIAIDEAAALVLEQYVATDQHLILVVDADRRLRSFEVCHD